MLHRGGGEHHETSCDDALGGEPVEFCSCLCNDRRFYRPATNGQPRYREVGRTEGRPCPGALRLRGSGSLLPKGLARRQAKSAVVRQTRRGLVETWPLGASPEIIFTSAEV